MISQEFYITKNKYAPFLDYCLVVFLALVVGHCFTLTSEKELFDINSDVWFRAFILIIIAFIWNYYRLKRTSLIFSKNYLFINHKRYKYTEVEKCWMDSTYVPSALFSYARDIYRADMTKVLCIKIKNKFSPYFFYLQYNFSSQQKDEIIKTLAGTPIKIEEGKLWGFNEIFGTIIVWGGLIWLIEAFF